MFSLHTVKAKHDNSAIHRQGGFTLIEVMIVVVIVGILAAIAIPAYDNYIIETRRTEMMTELQSIGKEVESRKIINGNYETIELSDVFKGPVNASGEAQYPLSQPLYTISITPVNLANTRTGGTMTMDGGNWKLTASPIPTGQMSSDGNLTLDYTGEKCHVADCSSGDGWQN